MARKRDKKSLNFIRNLTSSAVKNSVLSKDDSLLESQIAVLESMFEPVKLVLEDVCYMLERVKHVRTTSDYLKTWDELRPRLKRHSIYNLILSRIIHRRVTPDTNTVLLEDEQFNEYLTSGKMPDEPTSESIPVTETGGIISYKTVIEGSTKRIAEVFKESDAESDLIFYNAAIAECTYVRLVLASIGIYRGYLDRNVHVTQFASFINRVSCIRTGPDYMLQSYTIGIMYTMLAGLGRALGVGVRDEYLPERGKLPTLAARTVIYNASPAQFLEMSEREVTKYYKQAVEDFEIFKTLVAKLYERGIPLKDDQQPTSE